MPNNATISPSELIIALLAITISTFFIMNLIVPPVYKPIYFVLRVSHYFGRFLTNRTLLAPFLGDTMDLFRIYAKF